MKTLLSFVLVCFSMLSVFAQTNYYVSPTGSNINIGSLTSPFKTIQHAWNQLAAGDTLNIMAGTYNEKLNLNKSGTGGARITLRNYTSDVPLLSGTGISTQDAMIQINDRSNINVMGLEIANNIQLDAQGIAAMGNPRNITIANCIIHDIHFSSNPNATVNANTNAQGIIVYGNYTSAVASNILITGNELYNCRLGYSEGIAINGNIDGFEVTGNYVHDITNIGIDAIGHEGTCAVAAYDQARNGLISNNKIHNCISPYATSGGIYVDGAKHVIIERNTTYHNGYGIEVGCENVGKSADSIVVRSNFIYDNEIAGIAIGGYDYPSGSGKVTNVLVESNTLFKNDYTNSGAGELLVSYVEAAKVYNNIMYAGPQNIMFYIEANIMQIDLDNNLYFASPGLNNMEFYFNGNSMEGLAQYQTTMNQDPHSIYAIPAFVSTTLPNPNLHLSSGSVCINYGTSHSNAAQQSDIDGEPRLNGVIDMGADEYYGTTSVEDIQAIFVKLYPNPTGGVLHIEAEDMENVTLYNMSGQLLLQQQTNVLDMKALVDGVYFLHIKTKQGSAAKRIVKTAFDGQ
ncbi:MAG: right-handed parallel beta-helix repeat-containing protein [Bacteroidetes bacterium]|nr:right-handed parallel beta-helix repeat-containing protein [Bacteroidota bacterium]